MAAPKLHKLATSHMPVRLPNSTLSMKSFSILAHFDPTSCLPLITSNKFWNILCMIYEFYIFSLFFEESEKLYANNLLHVFIYLFICIHFYKHFRKKKLKNIFFEASFKKIKNLSFQNYLKPFWAPSTKNAISFKIVLINFGFWGVPGTVLNRFRHYPKMTPEPFRTVLGKGKNK